MTTACRDEREKPTCLRCYSIAHLNLKRPMKDTNYMQQQQLATFRLLGSQN